MTTTKSYDYLNRLTSINSSSSSSSSSFSYQYNSANQRTKNVLADGSYWVYQYDSLGQVTGGVKHFYDGTLVPGQQFGYGFDDIGNREQTTAGGDSVGASLRLASYSVNNLNQITQRDYPGTNDVIGAALATNVVIVNGQTAWRKGEYFWAPAKATNATTAQWENFQVVSGGTTNSGNIFFPKTKEMFAYDADGNLTNDGRWSYIWDAENRLVEMTNNSGVGPDYDLAFAYDAKSRRIQKTVCTNGVGVYTNNFLYDGWNLVAMLSPNSSLQSSYTWGNDLSGSQQGAGGVGGLLVANYSGTNCFSAFDGNGNLASLINAADGTTLANYEYGPFGEVIRNSGPMAKNNPMRFSTKYQDDESDLLYYGYRYNKPSNGTWINRDFIGEQGGPNVYAFIGNSAINDVDVFGEQLYVQVERPVDISCAQWQSPRNIGDDVTFDEKSYLIQEIRATLSVYDISGMMPVLIRTEQHHYWEAFGRSPAGPPFMPNQVISARDYWGYDPNFSPRTTMGIETVTGVIKIFPIGTTGILGAPNGGPIDPGVGWMPPADHWSINLPSTIVEPTWWNNDTTPSLDGQVTTTASFYWSCSCVNSDAYLSTTPPPE